MHSRTRAIGLITTAALAAAFAVAAPVSAANPAGNNGTIKIDGDPFDNLPDNEPHVGCVFEVDFYGYDEGALNADLTFEAVAPTKGGIVGTGSTFIGGDDNSGGGSLAGYDGSIVVPLDLAGITPLPQQGWHIKLTVHADGSQGADTKYKTFWVTGCDPCQQPTGPGTDPNQDQ
jgi:hypothetical protein